MPYETPQQRQRQQPELFARFDAAMGQGTVHTAVPLPAAYAFDRFATVADIGGGDGTVRAWVRCPRSAPGVPATGWTVAAPCRAGVVP